MWVAKAAKKNNKINQVPFRVHSLIKNSNRTKWFSLHAGKNISKNTYCYCDLPQDVLLDGFALLDDLLVEFIQRRVHQFHADPNISLETQNGSSKKKRQWCTNKHTTTTTTSTIHRQIYYYKRSRVLFFDIGFFSTVRYCSIERPTTTKRWLTSLKRAP